MFLGDLSITDRRRQLQQVSQNCVGSNPQTTTKTYKDRRPWNPTRNARVEVNPLDEILRPSQQQTPGLPDEPMEGRGLELRRWRNVTNGQPKPEGSACHEHPTPATPARGSAHAAGGLHLRAALWFLAALGK